jgi:hypothetical protein
MKALLPGSLQPPRRHQLTDNFLSLVEPVGA